MTANPGAAAPDLDPTAAALAGEVVAIVSDVLGDALSGAYLHGSAVLGGLRATSDLDILAVVSRPTAADERRRIVRRLLEISGRRAARGPARPVELTIVRADQLRPWRFPPTVDLLYGEWLRDAFERDEIPEPFPMPELGPEVAILRANGRALAGPPIEDAFAPVPAADLRRAVAAGVPGLVADLDGDTRNVLLTLARAWFTLAIGEITTKDRAATWAIKRLSAAHRPPLERARSMYLEGWDEDDWGDRAPAARALAAELVTAIERESESLAPA